MIKNATIHHLIILFSYRIEKLKYLNELIIIGFRMKSDKQIV